MVGVGLLGWAGLVGCWYTEDELRAALTAGRAYYCVEGESAPNTDAPADYTAEASIEMIGIPSGSFCMGSEDGDSDEQPVHGVTLTRPFWMGRTEVTQAQYEAVTGEAPSSNAGCDDCPVEEVSWEEAAVFANDVSSAEGLDPCYEADGSDLLSALGGDPYACEGYRLPTEAEWEYAARAGEDWAYAGSDDVDAVAWTSDNSDSTMPVATLDPNAWGLYDLSGNVYEWTGEWYDSGYYDVSPASDPGGPASESFRVFRGGSWNGSPASARVALRAGDSPGVRRIILGLRLVRAVP